MIYCKVCGAKIRANAAAEEYDPATGENVYTCRKCARTFARAAKLAKPS
jgi:ribosome-binding protein aMBF1 (putative translation factor)